MNTKQALLLVDIQNDYFDGGSFPLAGSREASENAKRILERFREKGLPVFHIQHIAVDPQATFFRPHSPGAKIHENVKPIEGEMVVEKHYPNSFRGTGLLDYLWHAEAKTVVLCGMMTHMCVDATVRAGKDLGVNFIVIGDACATRDLEFQGNTVAAADVQAAFLAALSYFYAEIKTTQDFLDEN
ncbi:MAG: cysteine hydrolase family protein [Thermoguttaceae bacterium]